VSLTAPGDVGIKAHHKLKVGDCIMKPIHVIGFILLCLAVNWVRMGMWDACGFESEYEAHLLASIMCAMGI
jgi:hypothetical protein